MPDTARTFTIERRLTSGQAARRDRVIDAARGLVLLFGVGTKALPSWNSKTRWNNLMGGLAVN